MGDPRALERCVIAPEDCSPKILQQLELLQQHKGIAMANDIILVDFCARSPFASSLTFCEGRNAEAMLAHLHKYSDAEYMNLPLLSCVHGGECKRETRTHLDNLLLQPEALVPIEHILMYLCHRAEYADELAVCVAASDIVQLAHCSSDSALCPSHLLVALSDLQKHQGI